MEELTFTLERKWPKKDYIIGRLYHNGSFMCNTLELPWLDNKKSVSCIPTGEYLISITYSSKFKRLLPLLHNVKGRSAIRIHAGNTNKDTNGCILPGENKKAGMVLNSRKYEDIIVKLIQENKGYAKIIIK